jgi:hypothetical protein
VSRKWAIPHRIRKISDQHHPIANLENPFAIIAIDIAEGSSKLRIGDGLSAIFGTKWLVADSTDQPERAGREQFFDR